MTGSTHVPVTRETKELAAHVGRKPAISIVKAHDHVPTRFEQGQEPLNPPYGSAV
jgi:hypothetical protein